MSRYESKVNKIQIENITRIREELAKMLYLKEANMEDIEKEYEFITNQPSDENGFTNSYEGVDRETFEDEVLPMLIAHSKGEQLKPGYVPSTQYFLWEDDQIVGLFRIRHFLNDTLREGAGHIGYGIRKECRGKGYASKGLALIIEKAKSIIPESEIYLAVHKNNPASLQVQIKNGAYIHHEDEEDYYTRIPFEK